MVTYGAWVINNKNFLGATERSLLPNYVEQGRRDRTRWKNIVEEDFIRKVVICFLKMLAR